MTGIGRRDFLTGLAAAGCAPLSLGSLLEALGAAPPGMRRVDLSESLPGNRVQCHVCPMDCILQDGQTCFCRTRTNHGGQLYTDAYENPCILRLDNIEKLPLHHYKPATKALSLAVGGCNLRCQYCQNWAQAFKRPRELRNLGFPVRKAGRPLKKARIETLALAYTEPVAFLEYAVDLGKTLRNQGYEMVAATGAYANPPAMKLLAEQCSALVLALKGFREDFYRRICGVHLKPVLASIEAAKSTGTWIEITNLIVPTLNDGEKETKDLAKWIVRNVGKDTPLHIARFVPNHNLKNLPRTPLETLERAREIARGEGLRFVYLSNVAPHEGNHSFCPRCGEVLIRRIGFKVLEKRLKKDRCPKCRRRMPGPVL